MLNYVITIFIIVLIVEIFYLFKFNKILRKNFLFLYKLTKLIYFKKASDHWKEKAILNYSKNLLIFSFKLLTFIIIIFLVIFIINFYSKNYFYFLISLNGIVECIIVSIMYLFLRRKVND